MPQPLPPPGAAPPRPVVLNVPAPATIQAAVLPIAQGGLGAVPGTILAAPLAPKDGPVVVAVAPVPGKEPLFTVAGRLLWSSPTAKAAWKILAGFGLVGLVAAGLILNAALTSGLSVWQLPWGAAGTAFVTAFVGAAVTAFFVWMKTRDHNIVVKAAP